MVATIISKLVIFHYQSPQCSWFHLQSFDIYAYTEKLIAISLLCCDSRFGEINDHCWLPVSENTRDNNTKRYYTCLFPFLLPLRFRKFRRKSCSNNTRKSKMTVLKDFGMQFKWFVHVISFHTAVVVHDVMSRQPCNVIILHNGANSVPIHKNQTTLLRPTGSQEWSLISPKRETQQKSECVYFKEFAYGIKYIEDSDLIFRSFHRIERNNCLCDTWAQHWVAVVPALCRVYRL